MSKTAKWWWDLLLRKTSSNTLKAIESSNKSYLLFLCIALPKLWKWFKMKKKTSSKLVPEWAERSSRRRSSFTLWLGWTSRDATRKSKLSQRILMEFQKTNIFISLLGEPVNQTAMRIMKKLHQVERKRRPELVEVKNRKKKCSFPSLQTKKESITNSNSLLRRTIPPKLCIVFVERVGRK